jgi:hypothetical protein
MKLKMVYTPTYVQDPDTGEDFEIHTADKDKLAELYDRLPEGSADKETLEHYQNSLGSNGDPCCHRPTTYAFYSTYENGK